MVCLGSEPRSFCHFWDGTQVLYFRLFCWLRATPFLLKWEEILATVVDTTVIWGNSPIPAHFSSLIPKMSMVHSCHLLFDHSQFALIHGPNIPGSYATLFFTVSDFVSITRHIHNWVLFLLWFHPFIPSGVISPLISSSILGTYRPGEFIFQCPIFLPLHTVLGVLKARILKWFAIPFSSGPHSVRPLHHDPSILGGPRRHGLVSLR